ncbi:MAG: hypothetical protein HQK93_04550 [Nitrospirae bacterium]|nr:hypothetical protein [Nitrospirota bacterium]
MEANVGLYIFIPSLIFFLYSKDWISKKLVQIFISIIVLLGVGICNTVVKMYDNDWQQQRSIWWQFVWRVPQLKEGTSVIIDIPRDEEFVRGFWEYFSLSGMIDILYAKSNGSKGIAKYYAFDSINLLEIVNQFINKQTNSEINIPPSFLSDEGYKINPKNLLVASMKDGYLSINGEMDSNDQRFNLKPLMNDYKQIIYNKSETAYPFRWIIGPEPDLSGSNIYKKYINEMFFSKNVIEKDWRYYYQNAVASLNRSDYNNVVKLYNDAINLGNIPKIPEIFVPFIETFYITADYSTGRLLLWKWVIYSNGTHQKAMDMKNKLNGLSSNSDCVNMLDKDIKEIWGTKN